MPGSPWRPNALAAKLLPPRGKAKLASCTRAVSIALLIAGSALLTAAVAYLYCVHTPPAGTQLSTTTDYQLHAWLRCRKQHNASSDCHTPKVAAFVYGSTVDAANGRSSSSSPENRSNRTNSNHWQQTTLDQWSAGSHVKDLFNHPAVFTLSQLGLWQTTFFGKVSSSSSSHGLAIALNKSAGSAAIQHQQPVLLQHWWRARCSRKNSSGSMFLDLRGVGSAYAVEDPSSMGQLVPDYVTAPLTKLNMTDQATGRTWTMHQAPGPKPRDHNAWHIEANGLSTNTSHTLSSAGGLSTHTFHVEASRCSHSQNVFRPGSVWSVIAEAGRYSITLYAKLVAQHTSYHQRLGMTGSILIMTRPTAAALLKEPPLQPGLKAGSYVIILWDGDSVPSLPYYHQSLWYNLVLQATWGVPDLHLAFIDLDEYYVLPSHSSFQQAFSPAGCLQGLSQARVNRHNIHFGYTAANARACLSAGKQPSVGDPAYLTPSRAGLETINGSGSPKVTNTCNVNKVADILPLTEIGWQKMFQQRQQYMERYPLAGPRWAHKSVVDPNYVAAYYIHEAQHMLPNGVDSKQPVPASCAFGVHLVNMYGYRNMGSGERAGFDMGKYVIQQLLKQEA